MGIASDYGIIVQDVITKCRSKQSKHATMNRKLHNSFKKEIT